MANISSFRTNLSGGGARPAHFKVTLSYPGGTGLTGNKATNDSFLIKAASLPASTVQSIEVPWRGRMTKIAGERVFSNWQVTIINDNDFYHRKLLEQWSHKMLNNDMTNGLIKPADYSTDLIVEQLDRNSETAIQTYTFKACWPVSVGEISLDFGNSNAIEEYNVEFSVDYWENAATTVAAVSNPII